MSSGPLEAPPVGAPLRRARARPALVYLIAPVVAAVAVRSWFSPGRFIAAGDIGPFLRNGLASDLGHLWGYGLTGAGSATAEVARSIEVGVIGVTSWLGGGEIVAQQVFYWIWLTAASLGCMILARQVVRSSWAVASVGVLALANPIMAVNLPNPLVPAAVATLTLVAAALVRAAQGRGSVALTVLATLPAGYLSINPPTLVVVVTASGAFAVALVAGHHRRRVLRHLAVALPLGLMAHLWWLVPAAIVFGGGRGATVAAVTDAEAWSWTQVNNSIPNVVTLTANWGWGLHEYLPFSKALEQQPLAWARWALPALVILAPIVGADRPRRRIALVALVLAAGAVFIGKGLHEPFSAANALLYREVPGMWLLREPMSKVGPLLVILYLLAAAITIDGLTARHPVRALRGRPEQIRAISRRSRASLLGRTVAGILVAAAVVFGHPVLTGGIAPKERTPLPSSRVEVPRGWHALADSVNADPLPGKALVLPMLPFYQATTSWGFHGAATLPRDLLRRPTLLGLPGGYFADPEVVTSLIELVSHASDRAQVSRALDALGVSHVIVRTDLSDDQAVRPISDGRAIADRLGSSGLFDRPSEFGVAVVLRNRHEVPPITVHDRLASLEVDGADSTARAVSSLPEEVVAVEGLAPGRADAVAVDGEAARAQTVFSTPRDGSFRLSTRREVAAHAAVRRVADGVMVDPRVQVRVNGRVIAASEPVLVPAPPGGAEPVALVIGDEAVLLKSMGSMADLPAGAPLGVLASSAPPHVISSWGPVGDCNDVDGTKPRLRARREGGAVVLSASGHAACVWAPTSVTGRSLLHFEYRVQRGPSARVCLYDDARGRCVWTRKLEGTGPAWSQAAAIVDAPARGRLFLYADAGLERAEVAYREVQLTPLVAGPVVTAPWNKLASIVALPAGDNEIAIERLVPPSRVDTASAVSNCNARGDATILDASFAGDVVTLRADGDAACVAYELEGFTPGATYEVNLPYRTSPARPGRWCLWLERPQRCANQEQILAPSRGWATHESQVFVPEGVGGARLFVYADGGSGRGGLTVNQYGRPSVRAVAPVTLAVESVPGGSGIATLRPPPRDGLMPGRRLEATVLGDGRPLVLALRDAADRSWELDGLPVGATAEPVVIDGYRQGWMIEGLGGTAQLTARYSLERWAADARQISITALALTAAVSGSTAWSHWRWRPPRRRPDTERPGQPSRPGRR